MKQKKIKRKENGVWIERKRTAVDREKGEALGVLQFHLLLVLLLWRKDFFFFISDCLFVVFLSCIWTSNWLVGNRKAVPLLVFFRT